MSRLVHNASEAISFFGSSARTAATILARFADFARADDYAVYAEVARAVRSRAE